MSLQLSPIDIYFLLKEIRPLLIGSRLTKSYSAKRRLLFYNKDYEEVILAFHKKGKIFLRIFLPGLIFLSTRKEEVPLKPSGFIMFLRKYLSNALVIDIKQLSSERIIYLHLRKFIKDNNQLLEKDYLLIIELLPPGNIILTRYDNKDNDIANNKILYLFKYQTYKDRILKPNNPYILPPSQLDIINLNEKELLEKIILIKNDFKDLSLIKFLATKCSLGGYYSELIINNLGLEEEKKKLIRDFSNKNFEVLIKKIIRNIKTLLNNNPSPFIINNRLINFFNKNNLYDIYNFEEKSINYDLYKKNNIVYSLFSAFDINIRLPLNNIIWGFIEQNYAVKNEEKNINKVDKIIKSQEEQEEKLNKEIILNQKKGELIYTNYNLIKDIIRLLKEDPSSLKDNPYFINFDNKKRVLRIKLPNNI